MRKLLTPTQKTLELIERFDRVEALLAWAAAPREVALIMPRVGVGRDGPRPVLPDEPAWAELGRIDPAGHGHGSYDIVADQPVRLSPRVIRVTANNGSVMTGPGTNSYLVGGGERNEWAVIDPGPLSAEHVDAIVAAAPGPIRWIFATHTHHDHSPATALLQPRTGATVFGLEAAHTEWQDTGFRPDTRLHGGERIALPGADLARDPHAGPRVEPPVLSARGREDAVHRRPCDAGVDRRDQPARRRHGGLSRVAARAARRGSRVARAGPRLPDGRAAACDRGDHPPPAEARSQGRRRRCARSRPASAETLLPQVYDDVPERLHPVALRSLRAHLLKLHDDGAAEEVGGAWSLRG